MQDDATAPAPAIRAGHLTATDAMAAATGAARAADHLGCIPVLAPDPGLAHAASLADAPGFPSVTLPSGATPTITDRDFTIATIVAPSSLKSDEGDTTVTDEAEGEGE